MAARSACCVSSARARRSNDGDGAQSDVAEARARTRQRVDGPPGEFLAKVMSAAPSYHAPRGRDGDGHMKRVKKSGAEMVSNRTRARARTQAKRSRATTRAKDCCFVAKARASRDDDRRGRARARRRGRDPLRGATGADRDARTRAWRAAGLNHLDTCASRRARSRASLPLVPPRRRA